MSRASSALLLVAALCTQGCVAAAVANTARGESSRAVAMVMETERPDLDSDAAAACVQRAMSLREIGYLGTADTHRTVSGPWRTSILEYAARPEAAECLDALPPRSDGDA